MACGSGCSLNVMLSDPSRFVHEIRQDDAHVYWAAHSHPVPGVGDVQQLSSADKPIGTAHDLANYNGSAEPVYYGPLFYEVSGNGFGTTIADAGFTQLFMNNGIPSYPKVELVGHTLYGYGQMGGGSLDSVFAVDLDNPGFRLVRMDLPPQTVTSPNVRAFAADESNTYVLGTCVQGSSHVDAISNFDGGLHTVVGTVACDTEAELLSDGSHLYWREVIGTNSVIHLVTLSDNSAGVLYGGTGITHGLAVDGARLYFSDAPGRLVAVPKSLPAGSVEVMATYASTESVEKIIVDLDHVYWNTAHQVLSIHK